MVGFRIPLAGFRIPKPWIPDSTDQNYLDSGFPDYLTWGDNHVNLTFSFSNFLVLKYPLFFYHCIIVFSSASVSRCYSVFIYSI